MIFSSSSVASQDLFQKATEIKLRLMQTRPDKSLITQCSFDQSQLTDYPQSRTSMSSLASSTVNLKDKTRIPVIKERRTTMMGQHQLEIDKAKLISMHDRHPKSIMKQRRKNDDFFKTNLFRFSIESFGTSIDEIDYEGSEISSISRKSIMTDRARNTRKQRYIFHNRLKSFYLSIFLACTYVEMIYHRITIIKCN